MEACVNRASASDEERLEVLNEGSPMERRVLACRRQSERPLGPPYVSELPVCCFCTSPEQCLELLTGCGHRGRGVSLPHSRNRGAQSCRVSLGCVPSLSAVEWSGKNHFTSLGLHFFICRSRSQSSPWHQVLVKYGLPGTGSLSQTGPSLAPSKDMGTCHCPCDWAAPGAPCSDWTLATEHGS